MTIFTNASTIEIAWSALALPGLALSIYNANGATHDLRVHWRDELRPLGWVGLAKVLIVMAMCLLVLASGLAAVAAPEPVRPELQDASDFIAACLILVDALTLVLAVAFFLERRYVVPHIHMLRDRP